MDPHKGAQDIMRCDLCGINGVQRYCDFCKVRLCQFCIGEHISDEYEKHKIVSFHDKNSTVKYPMCKTHPNKICKLQCGVTYMFVLNVWQWKNTKVMIF